MTEPKPRHLSPEYAAQFNDASVVAAYEHRPPYPAEVYEILLELLGTLPRVLLDLGCGPGEITRRLAPRVDEIHALDASALMVERARNLPGANHPAISWYVQPAEDFAYPGTYGLAIAGESFHWFEWVSVLQCLSRCLAPGAQLVLLERRLDNLPWHSDLVPIIREFSTNVDFQPYDLLEELSTRELFAPAGRRTTSPIIHRQGLDSYLESWHSRNGLSRERMGRRAEAFDLRVKDVLAPHVRDGTLEFSTEVRLAWGRPIRMGQRNQ
jgi:SAM-dependent methyltransferase